MDYRFNTQLVHAGFSPDSDFHDAVPAIHTTNAYTFENTAHAAALFELNAEGHIYSRMSNPTTDVLEKRVTALEGGTAAVAFSSGHAAMFCTFLNLAKAGDEIVASSHIYGGAINLLGVTMRKLGINFTFVHPDDFDAWENAITDKTKALFVELIGNPNANIANLEKLSALGQKYGLPLVVDSTFNTPYLCRPKDFGANIIVHSATKYLCGHGTTMAGITVDCGNFTWKNNPRFPEYNEGDPSYHGISFADRFGDVAFAVRLRALVLRDVGACLSPFAAFLGLQGLETLALRMDRHSENALKVAQFLEADPRVTKVNYPGLPSSPYYSLAQKYMPKGASGIMTIELEGGRETGGRFIDALSLFIHVANVGDLRSLVIHPATTTHSQLTDEQLVAAGITPGTVRLSVGIEDADDLIDDLKAALDKAFA